MIKDEQLLSKGGLYGVREGHVVEWRKWPESSLRTALDYA